MDFNAALLTAGAFGQGQEHGLLQPMVEGVQETFKTNVKASQQAKLTADSGYNNQATLEFLED